MPRGQEEGEVERLVEFVGPDVAGEPVERADPGLRDHGSFAGVALEQAAPLPVDVVRPGEDGSAGSPSGDWPQASDQLAESVDEEEDQRAYRGCPVVSEVLLSYDRGQAVAHVNRAT